MTASVTVDCIGYSFKNNIPTVRMKKNRMSHDYHNSVGSSSSNIADVKETFKSFNV
jgi:hypothetical protein